MEVIVLQPSIADDKKPSVHEEYDAEANISIERDMQFRAPNHALETNITHEHETILDSMMTSRQIVDKKKEAIVQSLSDINHYLKILSVQSIDNLESNIMTMTDANSLNNLDQEQLCIKKLVLCDLFKLGFKDFQIRSALAFHEGLPDDMTKEDALKRTLEHLVKLNHSSQDDVNSVTNTRSATANARKELGSSVMPVITLSDAIHEENLPNETENKNAQESIDELRALKHIESQVRQEGDAEDHQTSVEDKNIKPKSEIRTANRVNLEDSVDQSGVFTCSICYRTMPQHFVSPLLNCSHIFCDQCYVTYLKEQIDNNKVLNIPCPYDGCTERFQDSQIEKIMPFEQMKRYIQFKKGTLLSQNPNLRWCTRVGCDKYVVGKKGCRRLTCECGAKICFKCGNEYHSGKSCQTVIDNVYKKYAREKKLQNCPRCKSRTEKDGGCNHITCPACQHQWCWLCRENYTIDHYLPTNKKGCPGLLYAEKAPEIKQTWLDYIKKTLAVIGFLLMLPFVLVLLALQLPHHLYDKRKTEKYGPRYMHNPDNRPGLRFGLSLLGLVLFPISLIGIIIHSICSSGQFRQKLRPT